MIPHGCERTCPCHPYPDPLNNTGQYQPQPQPQPQPQVVHVEHPQGGGKDSGACATIWSVPLPISIQHPPMPSFPVASVSVRVVASPAAGAVKVVYYFREDILPHHVRTLAFCIRPFRFQKINHEDACGTAEDPRWSDHLPDTPLELESSRRFSAPTLTVRTQARDSFSVRRNYHHHSAIRGCRLGSHLVKSNTCQLTPSSYDGNYHRY